MEYLIRQGLPMRTAHETVGQLVAACEADGRRLAELTLEQLQAACDKIKPDVFDVLGVSNAVAVLSSYGSGGREPVREQLARWKSKFGQDA